MGAGRRAIGVMALFAGCGGLTDRGDNVVNGKQLFVAKCGSCHILNRAGTKGVTGPEPRPAFARARQDGFGDSTFEGIVHRQIGQPARRPQVDPATGKMLPMMPANLVTGEDARDVAAYVASAVAKGGKDQGALASGRRRRGQGHRQGQGRQARDPGRPGRRARLHVRGRRGPARASSRSTRRTSPRSTTTSRSRAAASTRSGRSSRTAASPRSTSTCRPASTRSSAPSPATARPAWRASSPSSERPVASRTHDRWRSPRGPDPGLAVLPARGVRGGARAHARARGAARARPGGSR